MRTDFSVSSLADPSGEGERFVIFRPGEIPMGFLFASSVEERLQALRPLTEEDFRLGLTNQHRLVARTSIEGSHTQDWTGG